MPVWVAVVAVVVVREIVSESVVTVVGAMNRWICQVNSY